MNTVWRLRGCTCGICQGFRPATEYMHCITLEPHRPCQAASLLSSLAAIRIHAKRISTFCAINRLVGVLSHCKGVLAQDVSCSSALQLRRCSKPTILSTSSLARDLLLF